MTKSKNISNKGITVFHQNIQGIRDKVNEMLIDTDSDIIGISEHFLSGVTIKRLPLPGYRLAAFYSRSSLQCGGVAMYVKNDFSSESIDFSKHCTEQIFECCAGVVNVNGTKLVIVVIYRSPDSDFKMFLPKLELVLGSLYRKYKNLIVCGDFNINCVGDSSRKSQLLDLFNSYNMMQTVFFPTRVQGNSSSTIDNIFVHSSLLEGHSVSRIVNGLSDHDAQLLILKSICSQTNVKHKYQLLRKVNPVAIETFLSLIKEQEWQDVYSADNADDKYNAFLNTFIMLFESCFPLERSKQGTFSNRQPGWMTKGIRVSCRTKRELYQNVRSSQNEDAVAHYKQYCKVLKNVIKNAKSMWYAKRIANSRDKIKTIWSVVKEVSGQEQQVEDITSVRSRNVSVTDKLDICAIFNNHFLNIVEELNKTLVSTGNHITFLENAFPRLLPEMILHDTSIGEIESIIKSLKTKDSCGYDGVSSRILKYCSPYVSPVLSHICNFSFQNGQFPNRLKYSVVKPLYKKGERDNVDNYRPISMPSVFSKVIEKAVYSRLIDHFSSHNFLSNVQFGFRSGLTTENAIFSFLCEALDGLNKRLRTLGVFFDLTKAFDCVDHKILLQKLEHYGIRGVAHNWFTSYFNNRQQKVILRSVENGYDVQSQWGTIKYGVPQGSVLGPLLFLIYINDMPSSITGDCKIFLFADDTSLVVKDVARNIDTVSNNAVQEISSWLIENKLMLNHSKTQFLQFLTHNLTKSDIMITHNGHVISETEQFKFLGVHIDSKLSWKAHVQDLVPKLNSAIFTIRTISEISDFSTRKVVYFAYFHSLMTYGIVFWGNSPDAKRIFLAQKRAVRAISGVSSRTSCRPLFSSLGILTLASQYVFSLMSFVVNNISLFPRVSSFHSVNTRQMSNLHLHHTTLTLVQKGVQYSAASIFNKLPQELKNLSTNPHAFKSKLKSYLVAHSFYSVEELLEKLNN